MILLFENSEDLIKYVPLNVGFEHELLISDVDDAMRDYILPYLSRTQFDISIANNDTKHIELISIVKKSAANIALANWLKIGKVQINESGISYAVDKDKQANSEDKNDAIQQAKAKGLKAIDQMLEFLEENAATFTGWSASESYTLFTNNYIRSAKEFGIINGSRSVFLALKAYLEDVQRDYLSHIPETSETLLLERKYSNVTSENKKIFEQLRTNFITPFLRDMAMAKAIIALAIVKDQYGTLTVFDNSGASHAKGYKNAPKNLLDAWSSELANSAMARLTKLNNYLQTHATVFGILTEEAEVREVYRNNLAHGTAFI